MALLVTSHNSVYLPCATAAQQMIRIRCGEIASLLATTGRSCRRCLRSSLVATSHNSAYADIPVTPQSVAPGTSHQARPVVRKLNQPL